MCHVEKPRIHEIVHGSACKTIFYSIIYSPFFLIVDQDKIREHRTCTLVNHGFRNTLESRVSLAAGCGFGYKQSLFIY